MANAGSGETTGANAAAPPPRHQQVTQLLTAVAPPKSPNRPLPRVLASLEVVGGELAGTRFQIERPVVAIGRGEQNDVRLSEGSVSASHATLLLKRGTWFIVDLGSANGTFVDGYRVAGERTLPAGCTVRVGTVKLTFRPAPDFSGPPQPTGRVVSILSRITKLLQPDR
jgi:pSer/pThr/pTyr-binding forkhead associated (FHA) protein